MKKRTLAIFLGLLLVFCLSSCACQHEWKEATCTEAKTCTKCGETEGEALGHKWTEATCTKAKECSRCGEESGEPLGHDVKEWKEESASTCSEAGKEVGTCTRCGETVTKDLPLAEHTPGDWEIKTKATSSSSGTRVKKCTVCGKELESENYTMTAAEVKQEYVAECKSYTYNEVARNPDNYIGKKAKFTGEVIQAMPDGDSYTLRVNVTKGRYVWDDTVLVSYTKQDSSESNILEDDIITMYGVLMGDYTYTSVMGASITVPSFAAEYIDIK